MDMTNEPTVLLSRFFQSQMPYFGSMTEAFSRALAQLATHREYEENEFIVKQDQHATSLHILLTGTASVYVSMRSRSMHTPIDISADTGPGAHAAIIAHADVSSTACQG
jgi:hypothetical protein